MALQLASHKLDEATCCFMTGSSNPELSREILDKLGVPAKETLQVKRFADGEIYVKIMDTVRGKDVYVIQSTSPPVNDNLMELLLVVSTARRASAKRITAIIPYYGYARQDRKVDSRTPISAADVAKMIEAMGVDRVVSVDLHCGQIQGFFSPTVPMDNLESHIVALDWMMPNIKFSSKVSVVSPDAGGVYRAKKFQEAMMSRGIPNPGLAMLIKHRSRPNQIEKMDLVGAVEGCDCLIIDDIVDTAGTLCEAARQLRLNGATRVVAFITHGLFSGPAVQRITDSELETVVVTNSIVGLNDEKVKACPKIQSVSIGGLLAGAIHSIQYKQSISALWGSKKAAKAPCGALPEKEAPACQAGSMPKAGSPMQEE
ncbi:unnamed protein product [Amoebophrya sp. A25]|nr:unnamed protein product [Amoebophrya sp. A25]|eukprot:GSA25T00022787001.1